MSYRYVMQEQGVMFFLERDPLHSMNSFAVTNPGQLIHPEGPSWLDASRMPIEQPLPNETLQAMRQGRAWAVNLRHPRCVEPLNLPGATKTKKRVNIVALGDVGGMLLTGLVLLGADVIDSIGIWDMNPALVTRYEYEMNEIAYPWAYDALPAVEQVDKEALFDCDVFVFAAASGVPRLDSGVKDVRMAQLTGNAKIIKEYAKMAREKDFRGLFAVISDPVDLLCRVAFLESSHNEEGKLDYCGLRPEQIQGYGLGVMNARAAYYAKRDPRFQEFLTEGRAYGPHGEQLVIANSLANYNDDISKELTTLAVEANLRIREMGFKPYIAPAISSGAISLLLTLKGEWHYASIPLGGVYFGCKTRFTPGGIVLEQAPQLPEALYQRLALTYEALSASLLPE